MKIKEKLEFHLHEIQRHKRAINDLGAYKKVYKLPNNFPFKMFCNNLVNCPKCNDRSHTFVFYRSRLLCSTCHHRKWGCMDLVKEWQIV